MKIAIGVFAAWLAGVGLVTWNDDARTLARTLYVWSWTHLTDQPVPDRFGGR